jgi:ATP-dependent Clp protease adaptor protein ClpS
MQDMGFEKPLVEEELLTIDELLEEVSFGKALVVYNDEVNTFQWVILSLMEVCQHTREQAEQCSMFIHFKGKYAVRHGDETELLPMKEALLERGITAKVEEMA